MAENPEDDSVERVGYIFHYISEEKLKPGDHIYCRRLGYSHHGIYIGEPDCEVIHFSGGKKGSSLKISSSPSETDSRSTRVLRKIAYSFTKIDEGQLQEEIDELYRISNESDDQEMQEIVALIKEYRELQGAPPNERFEEIKQILRDKIDMMRIRKTKLSDFCSGAWMRLVAYNCNNWFKMKHSKHQMKAMPINETVKLAKHFMDHPLEWGEYHLKENNCETFACFCKTGRMDIAAQLNLRGNESTPPFKTAEEALENYCQNAQQQ